MTANIFKENLLNIQYKNNKTGINIDIRLYIRAINKLPLEVYNI